MLTAALVIAGWAVVYVSAQRAIKRMNTELRREFQGRVDSLTEAVRALEQARIATAGTNLKSAPETTSRSVPAAPMAPAKPTTVAFEKAPAKAIVAATDSASLREELAPETLAVIAASITAFLGKKVRIRSVRTLQTQYEANAWARRGRVLVQGSHNFAQRGR